MHQLALCVRSCSETTLFIIIVFDVLVDPVESPEPQIDSGWIGRIFFGSERCVSQRRVEKVPPLLANRVSGDRD